MNFSFIFLLFLTTQLAVKQNAISSNIDSNFIFSDKDSTVIYPIDLSKNKLVYTEVRKYIKEQSDSSTLFKNGFGFITIENIKLYDHIPVKPRDFDTYGKDVIATFTISKTSYTLSDKYALTRYPSYYSFVDDKLILIYDQTFEWLASPVYTTESKKNIEKLVLNTLQQVFNENFVFVDPFKHDSFKLSKEQRKLMTNQQIIERAAFTINSSVIVKQHFDKSISYFYYNK